MQSINSQHSLPDPNPKPTHMKAAKRKGWQQVTPIPFLNPDPIAHLIGCSNEAPVIIDGQEVTALIDVGAQVSNISAQFCKELALQIQPLGRLLELEGTGDAAIPYLRFVEVNFQIPGIKSYHMKMCCFCLSPPWPTPRQFQSCVGQKDNQQSSEPHRLSGELAKATMTYGDKPTLGHSCQGHWNSPIAAQASASWQQGQQAPFNKVAL